ncbi:MAG: 50S ribosomal protein L11 methyltransferase [Planctomycetota bacterium]|nr:50S ribosomal protein L11 methyltransferase [Planctomycetota bacterium]
MSRIGLPTTLIVALTLVFGISNFASAADQPPVKTPDVVYVGTPHDVVAKMLELAKVTKADLVYDLGCGDGRIVVAAAKKYGCRGVGFDVNPVRVREAEENLRRNGVEKLVTIRPQDIFTVDLRQVTVVTLYLLPRLNVRLIPQLKKLPPGSRIVSHDFDMQGVKPDRVITMLSKEDAVEHTLYLWTTPLKLDDSDAESEEK